VGNLHFVKIYIYIYIYFLMVYGNVRKIIVKYILIEKQKVVLFYNLGKIKDKLLLVL
jgi:hypothetical protein